jgi:hypothetical protein
MRGRRRQMKGKKSLNPHEAALTIVLLSPTV